MKVQRKTNTNIGTSYSTLLQSSSFQDVPFPSETHYVGVGHNQVTVAFGSGGLSAIANASKSTNFNVTFTYVVI